MVDAAPLPPGFPEPVDADKRLVSENRGIVSIGDDEGGPATRAERIAEANRQIVAQREASLALCVGAVAPEHLP